MLHYEQDSVLLARLKAGDEKALVYLYDKYRDWLLLVSLTILGSDKDLDAKDVVQEFFIDFWEKKLYQRIDPGLGIRGYLHRCIHNRSINKIRDENRARKRIDHLKDMTSTFSPPDNRLENKDLHFQLNEAIKEVPPLSAQVFRLTYIEHKSRQEVAAEMGISPHTVRNQLVRAIKILRKLLKNT